MSMTLVLLLLVVFLLGAMTMNLVAGWFLRRVLQDVTEAYREDIRQTDRVLDFARGMTSESTSKGSSDE